MANLVKRKLGDVNLIEQGAVMIPTALTILYRLKDASAPVISVYGIIRNQDGTKQPPVLLNSNQLGGVSQDILLDSATPGLETAQRIELDCEDYIVDCKVEINGIEHLARKRHLFLHGRRERVDDDEDIVVE